MEIRNVLERLKLLTNDDREDLLLMLSGDAAQAAYQFWLLEEAASPKSLTAGDVRAEFDKGSERALAYAKQCERAVSGLLRDEDFYFGVTEGTV